MTVSSTEALCEVGQDAARSPRLRRRPSLTGALEDVFRQAGITLRQTPPR